MRLNSQTKLLTTTGKIGIGILLTLLCNLIMESDIKASNLWPTDIFPYIFLTLNCFVMVKMDWKNLLTWLAEDNVKVKCGCLFVICILIQCITLRIDLAENFILFIKTGMKVLMFGGMTAAAFIMCVYKTEVKKETPTLPFCCGALAGILYFFIIRLKGGYSIYPFLLIMLLYLTGEEEVTKSERRKKMTGAMILAFFETVGYVAITAWDYHGGFLLRLFFVVIGIGVWTFIFYYVVTVFFVMFDKWMSSSKVGQNAFDGKKLYGILFAMIIPRFLFWLNWFPGLLSHDSYVQIQQALGNEPYSDHHPWIHTMLIKLCMNIGNILFGSNQAGVAVTTFTSLFLSSLVLILVLKYFYHDVPVGVWRFAAFLYIMDPIHWIYSITIWKDVLFAYTMVAFCLLLMIIENLRWGRVKKHIWILYILISFLFCFARTNGLYAWLFTLPFIFWHYRKNLRPWLVSTLACFLLIVFYKGLVLPYFQVTPPDTVEALSVPLQQIAYTVQNEGIFSEYDESVISNIVDMESMGNVYTSHISDPVKKLIREEGNQEYITEKKWDFIKMYLSVGAKNPTDYVVAFLNQSRGFWFQKMMNDLYYTEGMYMYAGELGIYRHSFFSPQISQGIDRLLKKYDNSWNQLWSLALTTYVIVILFTYCFARKKTCFYFIPAIGVFLTLVIATPVNDAFRYYYGIYLMFPAMLLQIMRKT